MGERKGQNKYYPPDFDYKKHKSLAGYHGQHPLRERARKLGQGILIIRFEMPYNIWCDGCNNHVAMGVRYNAEKSKIGMYYTTPIYKFRMKCHLCDNHYEIKTDPANHDYVITSGARRKEQRWDPHENEQIVPEDRATQKKLALDSMYKLEHGVNDQVRSKTAAPSIAQIVDHQAAHKDDYLLNQLARKRFREIKKADKETISRDDEIKKKFCLEMDLVSESKDDARLAELLQYSAVESYDDRQKAKRKSIEARPLFSTEDQQTSTSSNNMTSSSSSSSSGPENRRKMATLTHIRQLTDATIARRRVAAFDTSSSSSKTGNNMKTNKLLTNLDVKSKLLSRKTVTMQRLKRRNYNNDVISDQVTADDGSHVLTLTDESTGVKKLSEGDISLQQSHLLSSEIVEFNSPVPHTTSSSHDAPVICVSTPFSTKWNALSSLAGEYDGSTSASNDSD